MSRRVDRASALSYRATGDTFLAPAEALAELADEGEGYDNAIGLLAVRAVITYTDTLTMLAAEQQSQGEHREARALPRRLIASALPKSEETRLYRVLDDKDALANNREHCTLDEA